MNIWQAIVLGAVQGFSEFLPISSSGHLILFQKWFGIENNVLFYSIVLHIGTLIPVIVVLWKQILGLFKDKCKGLLRLIVATIPAGIVGIILHFTVDFDEIFANQIWLLGLTFLITAFAMFFAEFYSKKHKQNLPLDYKSSFIMGVGQAVGVFPGISRSGATITAGTLARVDSESKAGFTFLMSIPMIVAAAGLEGLSVIKSGTIGSINILAVLFGVITAAVTGYIAIRFMLKLIKKANYKWFSVYLVLISIATFVTYFIK